MRLHILPFVLAPLVLQTGLLAEPLAIPEYRASYQAHYRVGAESGLLGQANVTVAYAAPDDTYEITMQMRSGPSDKEMVMRARARIDAGRLLPIELRMEERSGRKIVPASLLFDWAQQSLTLTYKKRSRERRLSKIEDRELRGIAEEVAGSTTLMLPGRLSLAQLDPMFVVTERKPEQIETPYGTVWARRVEFEGPSPDASIALWLAEDLDHLPVKIERYDGNRLETLVLSNLEGIALPGGGPDAN